MSIQEKEVTTKEGLPTLSISQEDGLSATLKEGEHDHAHLNQRSHSHGNGSGHTHGKEINNSTSSSTEEDEELEDSVAELNNSLSVRRGSETGGTLSVNSNGNDIGNSNPDSNGMTASEKRDHSRKHSRIHSRNLSVFFPRPGSEAEEESDLIKAKENFNSGIGHLSINTDSNSNENRNSNLIGGLNVPSSNSKSVGIGNISPTNSRRGHHSKHSVSFASTNTDSIGFDSLNSPLSPIGNEVHQHEHSHEGHSHSHEGHSHHQEGHSHSPTISPTHQNSHASHQHQSHSHSHSPTQRLKYSQAYSTPINSNSDSPFSSIPYLSKIPTNLIPSLIFGALHFLLGSSLWVSGQRNDSLSTTGLGYLVVFDSFGVLSLVGGEWNHGADAGLGIVEGGGSRERVRKPFR